jgi:class 3 adenylate cyclase
VASCARCGRENPEGSRFCNHCGAELAATPAAVHEERKVVTVLFADVAGSTALGERLDAEALKEVLGAFFDAMRAEIEAEGGTVEKFIGDAVMAAFGVPRVHEDDPARALRAALRMRARLDELNGELTGRFAVELALRIGINTGEVMAVTEPRPGEAMATGDAVNAAARLEQLAAPGQVLVSERTARAARGFHFAPPRALELRGKAEAVNAVELVAEQPVAEGTLSGMRAPLVGRRHELELLTATYRRAIEEGRPHLVTLYGEAGVGKSRLTGELLAGLEAATPTPAVLRGRCLAYGEGITYWPLAEMLKTYARVLDTDPLALAREHVATAAEAALGAAGVDEPAERAARLGASIGLASVDPERLSPQELRAEVHTAWMAFFSALAAVAPTVVVVEDIHWADAAVLDLLEHVADRASGPLLLLCLARPELRRRRPTWGGGRRSFTGIVLEPLSEPESARLTDLLLGPGADPRERAAILARAEGNPFFLEEIVRTRGAVAELPDTVQAAIAARIDLLPGEEKRVLQAAAVVGRVFWPAAVAQIAGVGRAQIDELLDRLQDRDLVLGRLSSSLSGERELVFKHALIRDVAHESLPRRDRVRMHADVADWIEQVYAGRRAEVIELIAHHRLAAHQAGPSEERRAAAFAALADASESAYARAGVERARSLAREALELAAGRLDRARALEALGYAAFATFDGSTAWESLREAADIVRAAAPDERARLAQICGRAVMIPVRAAGLMRIQPEEQEVAPYLALGLEAAGDEDSEALMLLLAAQGFWDFGYGISPDDPDGSRARAAGQRALQIARRLDRPDLQLIAYDALASSAGTRGLYGVARAFDPERLAVARRTHHPFEVGDTFYTAAWNAYEVGDYRDAVALAAEYEAEVEFAAPIGTLSIAAMARFALGDWDGALADQARVRELIGGWMMDAPPPFASGGYGTEALIHVARGEGAETVAEVEEWQLVGHRRRRWPLPHLALALVRLGELERMRSIVVELSGESAFGPRTLQLRCELIAEEGAWDEAHATVDAARRLAEAGRLLALPLHADRLEGRARLAAGAPDAAIAPLERARAGFARLDARWEVAGTELALGEALAAAGRTDEAAEVVSAAAAEFERLRVPRELGRARELLASAPRSAAGS